MVHPHVLDIGQDAEREVHMIQLAALDMAGTTIDDGGNVYVALRDAVADDELNAGTEVSAGAVQRWMGAEKRTAIRELTLLASGREADDAAIERMYGRFRTLLAKAYDDQPPKAFPGVAELFDALRANGTKVALTTGFARDVVDPLMALLGWTIGDDGTVDAVVCGDEVAQGRPAPYLIFRAMELTGVLAVDDVLVAGDTLVDLQAGVNAGVRAVIGVTTGKLDAAELGLERHTHLLPSVASIAELLHKF